MPDVLQSVSPWMMLAGFLLLLGPLVTLHELGHYLVGRWFGVRADVFSVGFGKEIIGHTDKRGTRWRLSALPLGGYVQFAGDMSPASQSSAEYLALPPEERAQCFQARPLWQKALIVAAGPVTNLLIAVLIFAGFALTYGTPVVPPVIREFSEDSPALAAGLQHDYSVATRSVARAHCKIVYYRRTYHHLNVVLLRQKFHLTLTKSTQDYSQMHWFFCS